MTLPDKIDLYIDDLLSPEEKVIFIEELKVNKGLKKEFDERIEFHKYLKKHFQYPYASMDPEELEDLSLSEEDELMINEDIEYYLERKDDSSEKGVASFKSFFHEIHKPGSKKNKKLYTIIAGIAAGMLIIFFAGLGVVNIYKYMSYKGKIEIVFHDYYAPQNDSFFIENKPDFITITNNGFELSEEQDIPHYYIYDDVVRGNNKDNLDMVYIALAQARENNTGAAIQILHDFIEYNEPYIIPEVNYYYALLLLKDHKYRKAITILKVLSEMDSPISRQAAEILKILQPL